MTAPAAVLVAAAGALVVLAVVLSAAEAALPRIGRIRLREIVESGRRNAGTLARLTEDPARALNVAAFTRVAAETLAVVSATLATAAWLDGWWQVLVVVGLAATVVSYAVVGAGPRAVGQRHPEAVALGIAPLLRGVDVAVGWVARGLAWAATSLTGRGPSPAGPFATEADLRDLLEQAEESSLIDREENLMAQRVLTLGSLTAREVMVPRTDMVTTARGVPLAEAMDLFLRSGYSRLPVVGSDADDVVGVCYLKDVAARLHPRSPGTPSASPGSPPHVPPGAPEAEGGTAAGGEAATPTATATVEQTMRPVIFVPESKPADDLLRELQEASVHLAVVVDEYGGVAGLATIEDLLEEIVGPISDEYDQDVPEAEPLGDLRWRVSAGMHLHSLSELVHFPVDDDDVDTVGGLLAKELGQVPLPGETTRRERLRLTAESRDGRRHRLRTVLVEVTEPPDPAEAATEERAHA